MIKIFLRSSCNQILKIFIEAVDQSVSISWSLMTNLLLNIKI